MQDIGTAVLGSALTFAQSRLDSLVNDAARSGETLVHSLLPVPPDAAQIAASAAPEIEQHLAEVKAQSVSFATRVSTPPATLAEIQAAADDLGGALRAFDAAALALAQLVPEVGDTRSAVLRAVRDAVRRVNDTLGGLASDLLDDQGSVSDAITVTPTGLSYRVTNAESRPMSGAAGAMLGLSGTTMGVTLDYLTPQTTLGLTFDTAIQTKLTGIEVIEALLNGADASVDVNLIVRIDTTNGLTLGAGSRHRIPLPARLSVPSVELRSFGLEIASFDGGTPSLELDGIMASGISALGMVLDGVGLSIGFDTGKITRGEIDAITVKPAVPSGIGLSIDAGLISGGGYLEERDRNYGGTLDLNVGPVDVKAIALLGTSPSFSFVALLSVEFTPAIQLSFGFTLNGIGGILAMNRTVSTSALMAGMRENTIDTLLFPRDPVGTAPIILDALQSVFPQSDGSLVVGPMFELGWGTPVSFVTAKIGVVIALPDPRLMIIGALRIALPTPEVAIVDLRGELLMEISPDRLLVFVALSNSRISGFPVSGDLGLLIGYGAHPEFAISAGGFHPQYRPPADLAGMRRMSIDLSPPALLTLRAEAYFALTTNSAQLGARIDLKAKVGPIGAEGYLSFDALLQWEPFLFIIDLNAGISLHAFGESFAGVNLSLHLEGPDPWIAYGTASVSLLFIDIDFEVGPLTWGEGSNPLPEPRSPLDLVAEALRDPAAWAGQLPPGVDSLVRLREDTTTPTLVHPLGAFEVRQRVAPLETPIDRLGRHPASERRINLGSPTVGGNPAGAFSHVLDRFAPGQFLNLTDDEKLSRPAFEERPSGIRLAAEDGTIAGTSVRSSYRWETTFPHRSFPSKFDMLRFEIDEIPLIVDTALVVRNEKARANAYLDGDPVDAIELTNPAPYAVVARSTGNPVEGLAGMVSAAEGYDLIALLERDNPELAPRLQLVKAGGKA